MPLVRRQAPSAARHRKITVPAAIVFVGVAASGAWLGAAAAFAQSVGAPPAQSLKHNGSDAPQVFPEVAWQLYSGLDSAGYTTQWTCGPFGHSAVAGLKVDSKLAIRVLASGGSASWTAVVPSDQTNWASGDETAAVAAQSAAVGDGEVGLTVTFLDSDFSRLAAGDYTITVTATITAN